MQELYISHGDLKGGKTDLDSVGSVSSLVRKAKKLNWKRGQEYDYVLIDYYNDSIDPLLRNRDRRIYLADIPPESILFSAKPSSVEYVRSLLETLRSQGNQLIYIDHHALVDEVREAFNRFRDEGLFTYLRLSPFSPQSDMLTPFDDKYCGTEMVQYYLFNQEQVQDDDTFRTIRVFSRDQDFGYRKIPEATRISAVIGSDYDNEKLIESFSDGIFWNDELQSRWKYSMERTQALCEKMISTWREISFKQKRRKIKKNFVFALTPDENGLKSTPAAHYLFDKFHPDFVVVLGRFGFLSIRRTHESKGISASLIARIFGGGGHDTAAAAGKRGGNSQFPYHRVDEKNFEATVNRLCGVIAGEYPTK